jgi:hypothetical protein
MKIEILEEGDCGDYSYFLFRTKILGIGFTRMGFMDNCRKYLKSVWVTFKEKEFVKKWSYENPPLTKEQEEQLNKEICKYFKIKEKNNE